MGPERRRSSIIALGGRNGPAGRRAKGGERAQGRSLKLHANYGIVATSGRCAACAASLRLRQLRRDETQFYGPRGRVGREI